MTARTRHGLRLTFDRGTWTDGKYAIGRVRGIEFCDGPHPERWRNQRTGLIETGYCPGDEEHDKEIGWDIRSAGSGLPPRDLPAHVGDDLFETLDEAWQELAAALINRKAQQ